MFAARQGFFSQQGFTLNIVTDGLSCYLNAGVSQSYPGSGTSWLDLSGNDRNFTWASTPTYGTDGVVPYLATLGNACLGPASNSFGINNTSGYTIFMLCRVVTLTQAGAFSFNRANATGTASRGIFAHLPWVDNNIYFDQGGCCASNTRTSVGSGGATSWNIWVFRRLTNSSTRSITKNNSVIATNTATAANIDLDSRPVYLGTSLEYGTTSSAWNAYLNGFIAYNRGLTDSEVTFNYNALRASLGI